MELTWHSSNFAYGFIFYAYKPKSVVISQLRIYLADNKKNNVKCANKTYDEVPSSD